MKKWVSWALLCFLSLVCSPAAFAADEASGWLQVNGEKVELRHAYAFLAENLFDDSQKDTMVILTDRPLPESQDPSDEIGLSQLAGKNEMVALRLRLEGAKVKGATLFHPAPDGLLLFPGRDLKYEGKPAESKAVAGRFSTSKPLEYEGVTWSAEATFSADIREPPPPEPEPEVESILPPPPPPAEPVAESKPDPAETAQKLALFLDALRSGKTDVALALIRSGLDVNKPDDYGFSPLNWAAMMCQPQVVQALVDAGANVNYERTPGYTVLQEAGACPAAAEILKKAGAR